MRNHRACRTVACVLGAASAAAWAGDENRLFNPGFEQANPDMPSLPLGWSGINVGADEWVDANDPGAMVHSGEHAIRLDPAASEGERFQGWTTNIFTPAGDDLYDPDYTYLGGDVHVSGFFLVPEGETLQDTIVGIKLEFRREPPNFSVWGSFEFAFPANTTGGFWMPFEFIVTDAMIKAVGDFPPDPTSVTILPFRFFGGDFGPGTSPTGTVFIDDLRVTQGSGGPCSDADFVEPFGVLDFFDVQAFLNAFSAHDAGADLNGDGLFDFFDVQNYLNLFSAGCP
jgi:hypothetical protein